MADYFKHFPIIDVPGAGAAKNIAVRPKINALDRATVNYTLPRPLRVDEIAGRYYNDEHLDWSVYMVNDVIDPYYQTYMDDNTLNRQIISQYGSLEAASQTIVYWKTNWREDTDPISVGTYESLPVDVKSYYNAKADRGVVKSYVRKRNTIFKQTNIIVRYKLNDPLVVQVGERVTLGVFDGTAAVKSIDSEYLTVEHVLNNYGVATINGVSVTIMLVAKSISDTEAPYYVPVSAYQDAVDANDKRRYIKLVPGSQGEVLRKELKRALR